MKETQVSDVGHLSVPVLADSALLVERLLEAGIADQALAEKLADRRKVFLDELVTRGALTHYSFV